MSRPLTEKEKKEGDVFTPIRKKPDGFKEKFGMFWDDFKWLCILGVVILLGGIYAFRSCTGMVKPDLTIMLVSSETVLPQDTADRLAADLAPCAMDENGDGVVKVEVSVSYHPSGTQTSSDELLSDYETKFTEELGAASSFIIICDQNVADYLSQSGACEPVSYFSKTLPANMVGIKISDTNILDSDANMKKAFGNYRVIARSFSKEGYGTKFSTRAEVNSAIIFFRHVMNSITAKNPA